MGRGGRIHCAMATVHGLGCHGGKGGKGGKGGIDHTNSAFHHPAPQADSSQ
jgi:hypothetical protein